MNREECFLKYIQTLIGIVGFAILVLKQPIYWCAILMRHFVPFLHNFAQKAPELIGFDDTA